LDLPGDVDTAKLFDSAFEAGISIAPGQIFSPCGRYSNCLRLSFGQPWSDRVEEAISWLGRRVQLLAEQIPRHRPEPEA
jgi:DNA-binding transcriptional MocR family regulator